jgi:hypothetical protein
LEIQMTMMILDEGVPSLSFRLEGVEQVVLWQPAKENTVLSLKTDPLWSLSNNKVSSYR